MDIRRWIMFVLMPKHHIDEKKVFQTSTYTESILLFEIAVKYFTDLFFEIVSYSKNISFQKKWCFFELYNLVAWNPSHNGVLFVMKNNKNYKKT